MKIHSCSCSAEKHSAKEAEACKAWGVKILVVEDNRKLARFLHQALTEEGYVVDVVNEGGEAIERSGEIGYDLVLLDWMLPDLDGLAVCRTFREKRHKVPILMLTARAEVAERIAGLDAGADDYLAKPFDLGELLARVRACIRRGADATAVTKIGSIFVDRLERRVCVDGATVELSPREFRLLAYLAKEPGKTVSRSELLANVWETSFDPGSNVVDVHIKNLRAHLGTAASQLETVRGVGYRLVSAP